MKSVLKAIIQFYVRIISPLMPPRCRFAPTCSHYMTEALEKHGVFKGLIVGFMRLLRCHPLSRRSGYDPVPEKLNWSIDLKGIIGYKRLTDNKRARHKPPQS